MNCSFLVAHWVSIMDTTVKYNLTQGFFMTTDPGTILARLLEVTRSLSLEADIESRLRVILSAAAELTGSETAALLEYSEASLDFRVKYVPWFNRETDKPVPAIPLNGSVAGWVFLNQALLVLEDAQNDARHSKKMDEVAGVTIRSVLGLPVVSKGKPFAVLEVFNKKRR